MAIRVLIVDDHKVVRQGLRLFLRVDPDLDIVGEARNGAEAIEPLTIILFRDITETQRLAQKTEVLTQFAATMTSATSLGGTLNALARSVVKATGIMACLIPLIRGSPLQFRVVGSYGLPNGYAAALGQLLRTGTRPPTIQAFSERRTIVVRGIRERNLADPCYAPVHAQLQQVVWDTVVCIPLIYRGTSLGVFTAYYPPGMQPTQGELVFLSTIATTRVVRDRRVSSCYNKTCGCSV